MGKTIIFNGLMTLSTSNQQPSPSHSSSVPSVTSLSIDPRRGGVAGAGGGAGGGVGGFSWGKSDEWDINSDIYWGFNGI